MGLSYLPPISQLLNTEYYNTTNVNVKTCGNNIANCTWWYCFFADSLIDFRVQQAATSIRHPNEPLCQPFLHQQLLQLFLENLIRAQDWISPRPRDGHPHVTTLSHSHGGHHLVVRGCHVPAAPLRKEPDPVGKQTSHLTRRGDSSNTGQNIPKREACLEGAEG